MSKLLAWIPSDGNVGGQDDGVREGLAEAVGRVGDRWSLLVVDALLDGPQRFGDLEAAVEGVAPNVLSRRLKDLVRDGVVVATRYQARPPRYQYELTAAGQDLAGALRLLALWGAERAGAPPPVRCPTCGLPAEEDEELGYA
jgi:DNA-binding HxlR family transcriptional regulator